MESQGRYLAIFLLFLLIDGFKWFWMESPYRNIQLMLGFLKAQFLVLHFSYHTLMNFLMLFVIFLPMLKILFTTLILIRHLIGGNNLELPSELDSDLQESVD